MRPTKWFAIVAVLTAFCAWWYFLVTHEEASFVRELPNLALSWGRQRPYSDGIRRDFPLTMQLNRRTLRKVSNWLSEATWEHSVGHYDLLWAEAWALDREVGKEANIADVIMFMSTYLSKRMTYLEVAPSAGKLLFQAVNYFEEALVFALEIEDINPTLARLLTETSPPVPLTGHAYPLGYSSPRMTPSTAAEYVHTSSKSVVRYLSADPLNAAAWELLVGNKYNVFVSGTRKRTAETLRYEYEMLQRFALLDDTEFVLVFLHLDTAEVEAVFADIAAQLTSSITVYSVVVRVRGTSGKNAAYDRVGIVTTLDLSDFTKRHSL